MTSKISFIKLIFDNIRHRGWIAALTCVVLFLIMPVYALLYLSSYSGNLSEPYVYDSLLNYFPGLISGYSMDLIGVIFVLLAIMAALTGFAYIHSREKLDFFHSLPIKRAKWFASIYLSGLLILFVPYTICAGLTAGVGAAEGIMTGEIASRCVQAFIGGILGIFVIYNACVFAAMLTGRAVTSLLASLTVIVYPFMVLSVLHLLQSSYFDSYFIFGNSLTDTLSRYLSPAGLFVSLTRMGAFGSLNLSYPAAALLMSAALAAVSVLLYRAYPSEAAGTAIAFPALAPVFKVLIVIPAGLFAGMMIPELMAISGNTLTLPLSLLAAVLLCVIIEFLYHMDIKKLLRDWKSSLVSVIGILFIVCIFQFDLTGYDTWLPDEDRIEAVSFHPDTFDSYFSYPAYEPDSSAALGPYAPEEDTDVLYALAQSGIDNLKNGITTASLYDSSDTETDTDYTPAVFRYQLSGGRTVMRKYAIRKEDAARALEQLLQSETYKKELFPIFSVDKDTVTDVGLADAYAVSESLGLSGSQQQALLDAYEKDLLGVSADTLLNEDPIAELSVDMPDPAYEDSTPVPSSYIASVSSYNSEAWAQMRMSMLYIYPEYTNTLGLLDEYGCTIRGKIAPEDVSSASLTLTAETIQDGKYSDMLSELSDTAEISTYDMEGGTSVYAYSEQDIALILDNITPYYSRLLSTDTGSGDYLDIEYKDGLSGGIPLK